jgi:hypothetical protein
MPDFRNHTRPVRTYGHSLQIRDRAQPSFVRLNLERSRGSLQPEREDALNYDYVDRDHAANPLAAGHGHSFGTRMAIN